MAGIFILIVVYVAFLIHLKPSLKTKKSAETDSDFEMLQQRLQEESVVTPGYAATRLETEETVVEPPRRVGFSQASKEEVESPKEPVAPSPKESSKMKALITQKDKESREKGGPGCSYFFGYLREIPKNTPIPDECLGCLRIMECLTKRSTSSRT